MEKRRPLSITELSLYLILLPFILSFLAQTVLLLHLRPSAYIAQLSSGFFSNFFEFISTWEGSVMVVLYGILVIGVFYLNNLARIGMVALTLGAAVAGPVAAITVAVVAASPLVRQYFISVYGLLPVIITYLIVALFSLASGLVAFYLTRPKVKEQFR